ncbi:MAG: hypothetical protein U0133_18305 [Gemmatimonadales bacterium]
MSRTFTNLGYTVTVEDDRSILVKPGDWISKYAAAIYGSTSEQYWGHFKEKVESPNYGPPRYKPLANPNLIRVGQRVYHPGPLPKEPGFAPRPPRPAPAPGVQEPTPEGALLADRFKQFLYYVYKIICPVTDWSFEGSTGIDGGVSFLAGQYAQITLRRDTDDALLTWHAASLGLSFGPDDFVPASLTISPPDFPSLGGIGKFVTAGATLSPDEICGNVVILDGGGGCLVGGSLSFMFFGMNAPPQAFARTLGRWFQGGSESPWVLPSLFKGLLVSVGPNLATPNLGISIKLGIMHRWECVAGE